VALLDEFASRFFDELDYVKECANGVAIRDQMQHIKQVYMDVVVVVSPPLQSLSSKNASLPRCDASRARRSLLSVACAPSLHYQR